ncbi:MAG: T9SS type A sorting domain-containing protein [Flavobacteriales bacterium]
MKTIFTLLLITNIFVANSSIAQTLPVAVNDTVYISFSDSSRIWIFQSYQIVANDTLGSGTYKIIDTVNYNGLNQVNVIMNSNPAFGVNRINYIISAGFFGKDSITYYLTDNGASTGFDTAFIYIYVKRKSYENIDLNNINARVDKNILFGDADEQGVSRFNVPKQILTTDPFYATIEGANLWIAGKNQNLVYSSSTTLEYNVSQIPPVIGSLRAGNAGPIMDSIFYEFYSDTWDRVWKINASDLQYHVSNYNLSGYQAIESIANWPAHGDTTKGQSYYLAPFVDVNFDGIYNPMMGDYPKIKGQQAVYFIRNDERDQAEIQRPMRSEIHGMVYAYNCSEDSAINNTIFLDYKIYNRSNRVYDSVYVGAWVNLDIGNQNDDFFGTDVSRGTFYAYNGDAFDEDANGVSGYGAYLPAQGVTFLKGVKQTNDGVDNPMTANIPIAITQNGIPYVGLGIGFDDGIIDNEFFGLTSSLLSWPHSTTDIQRYFQLQGKTNNGDDYTINNIPIKYMFPNDSDPLFWNTRGDSINPLAPIDNYASTGPLEIRGIGSTGPFTLMPDSVIEIELAFVFGIDYTTPGNNLAGVTVMQERVDSIRSYHTNGFATTVCGGSLIGVKEAIEKVKETNGLSIYPNPFANQFLVNYQPSLNTIVEVYNLLGGKILTQQITTHLTLLNLSNQPNGVYFVRVTDGKEVLTRKVVKQ